MDSEGVRYTIDRNDVITALGDSWGEFALANGAPELQADRVVSRSIWRFVSGMELRYLYGKIFKKVRAERTSLVLPFRCDSPSLRRYMVMTISGVAEGAIDFRTHLLKVEERDPAVSGTAAAVLRTACSWCNRFMLSATQWVEIEEAVMHLDLLSDEAVSITHGLCGDCAKRVDHELS